MMRFVIDSQVSGFLGNFGGKFMDLQQWLSEHGLDISPILDNKIHRFSTEGKKDKSGWYVGSVELQPNGTQVTSLTVSDHRTDERLYFRSGVGFENGALEKYKATIEKRKREVDEEIKRGYEETAKEAEKMWEAASKTDPNHPYLRKKEITDDKILERIRSSGVILFIPTYDSSQKLQGIQRIFPDGTKRFLKGQGTSGLFFRMDGSSDSPVLLSEGFATGCSIYQATGYTTYVAFTARNLGNIAKWLLSSSKRIVICADDDRWGEKNTGRDAAEQITKHSEGRASAIFPTFRVESYLKSPTDFNDLFVLEGIDEVKRQINSGLSLIHNEYLKVRRHEDNGSKAQETSVVDFRESKIDGGIINGDSHAKEEKESKTEENDQKTPKSGEISPKNGLNEEFDKKGKKKKFSQDEIERLGKVILDCRFKIYRDNEATMLYNISDIRKKEVAICTNEEVLLSRLRTNVEIETGKKLDIGLIKYIYSVWRFATVPLKNPPKSFTWQDEDDWSFKKLDFVPMEGEYDAWWEFLKRLSSYEDFMAFVWSIFEPKNKSRQFLWLSDLHGEGGKSTVISVLADIFGESFEALNNTNTGASAKWLMGQLYGKRLAAWADCKNPSFCMSETVRNITSGDWVTVEMKGQPLFSTKMYMKLIIGSNSEPHITGAGADTSRLIHLKLEQGEIKDDPTWAERLKKELPYFLYACRETYMAKCPHHGKIALSESTLEHVENASASTEEKFEEIIESRIQLGEDFRATVKQFHDLCKDEGFRDNFEIANFKAFLRRKGVSLRRPTASKARLYYGMSITIRGLG